MLVKFNLHDNQTPSLWQN